MKKLIITTFILFANIFFAKAQYTPLHLDIGTTWRVDFTCECGGSTPDVYHSKYKIIVDTFFNNFHYYIIDKKGYGSGLATNLLYDFAKFIRNDTLNKKVYAYNFEINNDTLIYNFDLHLGDTLKCTLNFQTPPPIVIVDTIGIMNVNGVNRKFYGNIKNGPFSNLIEGIGSEKGFTIYENFLPFEYNIETQCVKYNGTTLYGDTSMYCDLNVGINGITKQNDIKIYPNPASTLLQIEFLENENNSTKLKIYNPFGQLIASQKIVSNQKYYSINISALQSGVYFLKIGEVYKKFIVEK